MSDDVTEFGSSTTDAAADQIENLLGGEAEVVETEAEIETPYDGEVETEEVEAEGEAVEAPDEEEVEEPVELNSFDELQEALEIDLADLKTKVKVQGEEFEVTFDELRAGYQKGNDYAKNVESLKREREEFEQVQQQRLQMFEAAEAQTAMIVQQFEQDVLRQMDSEDMQRLRQMDETKWLAKRMEAQDQLNKIQQVKQAAAMRYQETQQQLMREQQEQMQKRLPQEAEMLSSKIPDWGPEIQSAVTDYLKSNSYGDEEIAGVVDHRAIVIANKARLWDEYQAQAKETTKKVKQAPPKMIKPSSKKPVKANNVQKLKNKLRQTHHIDDAASVIENML